jgi:formylglycine-generating enzyme required for sulfatase activity
MKKIYLPLVAMLMATSTLLANNIQLANTGLSDQNTGNHTSKIGFDVSWENSWRTSSNEKNWDAAWIFVKFRKKGASSWLHATLQTSGHTAATGSNVTVPSDGKGAFIYRSADGVGAVNFTGNKLVWSYGSDGVADADSVEINVYACEMVYVPQGAFYAGSNGSEDGHFRRGDKDSAFLISSENSLTISTNAANLYWTAAGSSGPASGTLPAVFPKGFKAFYCMKYECSQQQYVDFLNNLDEARAATRNPGGFTKAHPALEAPFPERALGFLSFNDHGAYADWAGLRPMTELEYEKASRGANIAPLPNEFAWGNTTVSYTSSLSEDGTTNETALSGNAHYYNNWFNRPLRSGAYATSTSTRVSSGGTYYGIMEMSGNLYERVISVGTANGKTFTGEHGDGNLAADGSSDIASFSTSTFYGFRGGHYLLSGATTQLATSYRGVAGLNDLSRSAASGIRCVRTVE